MTNSPPKLMREPKEVIRQAHSLFPRMFRQIEKVRWNNVVLERAARAKQRIPLTILEFAPSISRNKEITTGQWAF